VFESLFTGPGGAHAQQTVINSRVPDGALETYLWMTGRIADIDPDIPEP
jgi:hypothetical protein